MLDHRQVYTSEDVKNIVSYAMQRGVRVIPEFDVPGHAYSWGAGYPITANCPDWEANINNVPLNPTVPQTFTIVKAFLAEMAALFPDEMFHLGGDEVSALLFVHWPRAKRCCVSVFVLVWCVL